MSEKFDKQYLRIAQIWSENSYAKRLKVGAIIVKDQMIISDGFNGTVSGFKNECEYIEYQRKPHPRFEGVEVDTEGKIYKNEKQLNTWLSVCGKSYRCKIKGAIQKVSWLVMETFVENPDPNFYTQVNHINYNVEDNRLINLEWCSNRYNSIHRSQRMDKTCEHPGVHFDPNRNKWVAAVWTPEKYIHKRFDDPNEAVEFYKNSIDPRTFQTIKYTDIKTHPYVLHAEANAITKVAQSTNSSKDATLYTLVSPCMECSKLIIQAGIKRVVYAEEYRITEGIDLLRQAGIMVDQIEL